MSARLMGQVWELDIPRGERDVLMALADSADDDGGRCYPSVAHIAWKVGLSDRHVTRMLSTLREKKYISVTQHASGGRGLTTHYQLDLARAPKKRPWGEIRAERAAPPDEPTPSEKGDILSEKGDTMSRKGDIRDAKRVTPCPERVTSVTEKGDIRDSERVTSDAERVTSDAQKGDIAMSPEPSRTTALNPQRETSGDPSRAGAREAPLDDEDDVGYLDAMAPVLTEVLGVLVEPVDLGGIPPRWADEIGIALREVFPEPLDAVRWVRSLPRLPREGFTFRPSDPRKLPHWIRARLADHRHPVCQHEVRQSFLGD